MKSVLLSIVLLLTAVLITSPAAEKKADTRPLPPVVEPQYDGAPVPAPDGAVILFDGQDLSRWFQTPPKGDSAQDDTARWKVENGYIEVVPKTGFLRTRKPVITSGLLHIEWATPSVVKGAGQGRGNSGVFIDGFPEIQVLDSYQNITYPDGQAGALYKRSIPRVNASRKPGEWQSYDILIERAVLVGGKLDKPARLTVRHNNVLIQDGWETNNQAQQGTLGLQDHKNPVRYRNIWFVPNAP